MKSWKTDLGAATLWGLGFLENGREVPVSYHDIECDTVAAEAALNALRVPADGNILLVSTLPGIAHVWPFAVASARGSRAVYFADATAFDANRTEMFTRRINIDTIVGINADVMRGLSEMGDPYDVLKRARVVAADADLVDDLRAHGVNAVSWMLLGPAVAMECINGAVHYDGSQWSLSSDKDGLVVTAGRERALAGATFVTGIPATLSNDSCACGRSTGVILGGAR
jgi:hypothetical protein